MNDTVQAQQLVADVVRVRNGSLPATEKSVTSPMHGVGRCDARGRSGLPDARIVPGAGAEQCPLLGSPSGAFL